MTDYGDTLVAPVAHLEDGAALTPRSRQHHPLDGRAVARGCVQLPVRL